MRDPRLVRSSLTRLPWRALGLGLAAAGIFVFSASTRLDAQGLYVDELHQATASFAYVGQEPQAFAQLTVGSIPILNMNYSGAIKTAMYGLYLRLFDSGFNVWSWRLLGILITAAGLFFSALILRHVLPPLALGVFFILLLTDSTVILASRHDWGPVALALALRLALISLWISGEWGGNPAARNSGIIAALVGFSLFEKLTNGLLLVPLLLMLFCSPGRRSLAHLRAALLGLVIGASPLILANLYTLASRGYLVSLEISVNSNNLHTPAVLLRFLQNYVSLGAGDYARTFILGLQQHYLGPLETWLLPLVTISLGVGAMYLPLSLPRRRIAGVLLLCYASIALALFLFPQRTWIHHWIIGTPFHYAAIAVLVAALTERPIAPSLLKGLAIRILAVLLLLPLLVSRLGGFVWLQQSLLRGDASSAWDPSLTRLGEFAAQKSHAAVFIVADWGVSNQMLCYLNGAPGVLFQMAGEANIAGIRTFVEQSGRSEFYLVFSEPPHFVTRDQRMDIIEQVDREFAGAWSRQPLEPEASGLSAVVLVKYAR